MFISRDEMHINEDEWKKTHDIEIEPYPKGKADIIIAKHRNGPTGEVHLFFDPKTASFRNIEVGVGPAS